MVVLVGGWQFVLASSLPDWRSVWLGASVLTPWGHRRQTSIYKPLIFFAGGVVLCLLIHLCFHSDKKQEINLQGPYMALDFIACLKSSLVIVNNKLLSLVLCMPGFIDNATVDREFVGLYDLPFRSWWLWRDGWYARYFFVISSIDFLALIPYSFSSLIKRDLRGMYLSIPRKTTN